MRVLKYAVIAVIPLFLSGCMVDMLMSTAIEGELQKEQLGTLKKQLDNAKQTTSDIEVKHAIQIYAAEKGKYPASLEELVPDYLPQVPTQPDGSPYRYDPASGQIFDGPAQPVVPTHPPMSQGSNEDKMIQIRGAINQYGMATGYYPPSLQALVPTYLPAVPKANNGMDFIYTPENGALYEPAGTAPTRPMPAGGYGNTAPGGAGGGVSPMTEAMTGIGMQRQLDNMSNAGSSAAGSRARGDVRGIGQDHTQRQEQAMDDLGL